MNSVFFERLLTLALCIQLVLTFFCPPIPFGDRLVFASDLWLCVWALYFGYRLFIGSSKNEQKRDLKIFSGVFFVFFIVFIHGFNRPSMHDAFSKYLETPKDDLFIFSKEGIVTFRFFTWIIAAYVVYRSRLNAVLLMRTLAACCIGATLSMMIAKISPNIRTILGHIYGYDPDAMPWADRIYGVFRSPIEASVSLSLSLLILFDTRWAKKNRRAFIYLLVIIGIFLSKTITAFIAVFLALLLVFLSTMDRMRSRFMVASCLLFFVTVLFIFRNNFFVVAKYETFIFRFGLWSVYWNFLVSRIDRLIFGMGFHPHFSDNIYLFIFSRGGVLLTSATAFLLWKSWITRRLELHPIQNAIPLFFIISGLTVDSLIIRPSAMILVTVGMVALRSRHFINSQE